MKRDAKLMSTLRTIWWRLRRLAQRRAVTREIDEELRFHLEQRAAENMAAGLSPDAAARAARKRFGNLQNVREECREIRGFRWIDHFVQDTRFGLRLWRKQPGSFLLASVALTLGIGFPIRSVTFPWIW